MCYAMYNVKTPEHFLQVWFRVLSCTGKLIHLSNLHENIFSITLLLFKGAVSRRCSIKKVFFEILQNLQGNTCARVSFLIKLQGLQLY